VTHTSVTAREAAVLMAWLDERGATFTLRDDGSIRCRLDGADISDYADAERCAFAVAVP
jgi:hypothetical protein